MSIPKIIGLGLPKCGTHTLAKMLAMGGMRAAHEPGIAQFTSAHRTFNTAAMDAEIARQMRGADAVISTLNAHFVHRWLVNQPDAIYVLQLRRLVPWVASMASHHRRIPWPYGGDWNYWIRRHFDSTYFEPIDIAVGCLPFPIRSYCEYWSHTVENVIKLVPADRLRIISLETISAQGIALLEELGIPPLDVPHAYENPEPAYQAGQLSQATDYIHQLCQRVVDLVPSEARAHLI